MNTKTQYRHPVMFTVELVTSVSPNIEFQFAPLAESHAREMYACLVRTRGILRTLKEPELDGKYTIGVNLVAWDAHPSQENAVGLILAQQGWESE